MKRAAGFAGLFLLAFCIACRYCVPVADFYAVYLYPHISSALSCIASVLPYSLEEVVVIAFVVALVSVLVKAIKRKEGFLRWLGSSVVLVMWLYVWFYMGWGNNYYRTGLYQRNGLERTSYDRDSFNSFLEDYTEELNYSASAAGEYDRKELEAEIKAYYSKQVSSFGYSGLRPWQHVKKPLLNMLYSAVGVHGFMGPFFCETQLNLSLLDYEYPFTLAHEMGHLAGVTSEAEANYWGYTFCRSSLNPAVRYSGCLAILPYVASNAGVLLPEEEFQAWIDSISDKVKMDYTGSREYWLEKRVGWIESIQNSFYNLYLKSNGISEGVKDYSGVVEMIMTMDASGRSVSVFRPVPDYQEDSERH